MPNHSFILHTSPSDLSCQPFHSKANNRLTNCSLTITYFWAEVFLLKRGRSILILHLQKLSCFSPIGLEYQLDNIHVQSNMHHILFARIKHELERKNNISDFRVYFSLMLILYFWYLSLLCSTRKSDTKSVQSSNNFYLLSRSCSDLQLFIDKSLNKFSGSSKKFYQFISFPPRFSMISQVGSTTFLERKAVD